MSLVPSAKTVPEQKNWLFTNESVLLQSCWRLKLRDAEQQPHSPILARGPQPMLGQKPKQQPQLQDKNKKQSDKCFMTPNPSTCWTQGYIDHTVQNQYS